MRIGRWIGIVLLWATLAGCGDDDSLTLDEWFEGNVDSACEYYVECGLFSTVESCLLFFETTGAFNSSIAAAVDNGSVVFDGSAAKDCLDRFVEMGCELDAFADVDVCDDVLTGTLDNGQSCFLAVQCVSEYCEEPVFCLMQCCVGSCANEPAVGEPCPQFQCETGAYCEFSDDTCYASKGLSEPCDFDSECAVSLACINLGGTSRRCLEPPGAGDACDPSNPTFTCDGWGLTCDSATETCVDLLQVGDPCDPDNDLCSFIDAWCVPDTQTCAPLPGPGESCELTSCRFPSSCDSGADPPVCIAPAPNGALCDFSFDCESSYCNEFTGKCEDQPVCVTARQRQPAGPNERVLATASRTSPR